MAIKRKKKAQQRRRLSTLETEAKPWTPTISRSSVAELRQRLRQLTENSSEALQLGGEAELRARSLLRGFSPPSASVRAEVWHRNAPDRPEPAVFAIPAKLGSTGLGAPVGALARSEVLAALPLRRAPAPRDIEKVATVAAREKTPDERVTDGAMEMVEKAVLESALQLSTTAITEAAIHDFASYVFMRDPDLSSDFDTSSDPRELLSFRKFLDRAHEIIRAVVYAYAKNEARIYIHWRDAGSIVLGPGEWIDYSGGVTNFYLVRPMRAFFDALVERLFARFVEYVAEYLYGLRLRLSSESRGKELAALQAWLIPVVQNGSWDEAGGYSAEDPPVWVPAWQEIYALFRSMFPDVEIHDGPTALEDDYPFLPYPSREVNFGLRLTFRQLWRPLGTQAGEIVKTIPLGPKQSEKVSIKVATSLKTTRSSDSTTSRESSSESSTAVKDSSEVVREASDAWKVHAEAEASGSMGVFSAKASAGFSYEAASSSKDTKSRLSETMEKSANRMRSETKIVVSTEQSRTEETSTTSEIINSNEELAVTYVYKKLQRQYEIRTNLAEVASVVFVPERLPEWNEINERFIRRYHTQISAALLNDSLRSALDAALIPDTKPLTPSGTPSVFAQTAEQVSLNVKEYKAAAAAMPDIFRAPHEVHERELEKNRAAEDTNLRRSAAVNRLIDHLRDNILHYMRAIWSSEDMDQRMRRYAFRHVPTRWTYVATNAPNLPLTQAWPGEFVPDPSSLRKLSDIINPAGPIGYVCNYAVFFIRSDPSTVDLNDGLTLMRSPYVRFAVSTTPTNVEVVDAFVVNPLFRSANYDLTWVGNTWSAVRSDAAGAGIVPVFTKNTQEVVEFDGIRLRLKLPGPNATVSVRMEMTGELQDPEEKMLCMSFPLPPASERAAFFTASLLTKMVEVVPELKAALPSSVATQGFAAIANEPALVELVLRAYRPFLLRQEHTRRFVLDTNNVILDLEIGETPALEQFKRLHRSIDVLKALEEKRHAQLENERREDRLQKGLLTDPDIEKVVVRTEAGL